MLIENIYNFSAESFVSIKRLEEFLLRPQTKQCKQRTTKNSDEKSKDLEKLNVKYVDKNVTNPEEEAMLNRDKTIETLESHEDRTTLEAGTQNISENSAARVQNIESIEKFIRLENATAVWQLQRENCQMNGIFDLNTEINFGLCAIVGQVGSSKSTLLNVILGELELDSGTITINGSISYASQEPWLFDSSVRDNIVFVDDFDERRYKKVVKVCALERDFNMLPYGDSSIVGERGLSLSGGQKARINLARAIYRRADIYLLDDPLSAVDAHVGRHIFDLCVSEFLADKICVLVTHQIQYLKNVDHVILMKNGQIEAEGPFQTIQFYNKYPEEKDDNQNATPNSNRNRVAQQILFSVVQKNFNYQLVLLI